MGHVRSHRPRPFASLRVTLVLVAYLAVNNQAVFHSDSAAGVRLRSTIRNLVG